MKRPEPPEVPEEEDDPFRQLTPEECARFAASTKDLPKFGQLTTTDAELSEEERCQKPLQYRTTAEAIAAMKRRLADLRREKAEILDLLDDCTDKARERLLKMLEDVNTTIARTETRLDAHRFEQKRKK
ncbi:MAG TPA: hypothetical protein VMU04_23255 [Candidatus Acidoferrum sp.]|nr:hypothetical protein [Candidatus Acidoferrum sp.]